MEQRRVVGRSERFELTQNGPETIVNIRQANRRIEFERPVCHQVFSGPLDFDDIFPVTRDHLIRLPGYLELTSRCFGLMDREIPKETALAFKARVAQTLQGAGVHLERHFGKPKGTGVTLLLHSYGLIVGLWQLLHPNERFGRAMKRPELKSLDRDYEREIENALRALWHGWLAPANPRKTR